MDSLRRAETNPVVVVVDVLQKKSESAEAASSGRDQAAKLVNSVEKGAAPKSAKPVVDKSAKPVGDKSAKPVVEKSKPVGDKSAVDPAVVEKSKTPSSTTPIAATRQSTGNNGLATPVTGNLSETGQVCVVGHYYFSRIFCNNLSPYVPGCSLPPQELQQAVPQREAASDARQALPPRVQPAGRPQPLRHGPSLSQDQAGTKLSGESEWSSIIFSRVLSTWESTLVSSDVARK